MTQGYLHKEVYRMQNIQNIADESSDDEGFEIDENAVLKVNESEVDNIDSIDNSRCSSFFNRIVTSARRNLSLMSCKTILLSI